MHIKNYLEKLEEEKENLEKKFYGDKNDLKDLSRFSKKHGVENFEESGLFERNSNLYDRIITKAAKKKLKEEGGPDVSDVTISPISS